MTSYIYIFCASETKEKNIGQYIRILEFLNHQISVSVWKKKLYWSVPLSACPGCNPPLALWQLGQVPALKDKQTKYGLRL